MIGLVIRRARVGDAQAMSEVYVAAAREGWAHMFPPDELDQLSAPEELMVKQIEDPSSRRAVLVAELDGAIVGFAVVRRSEDEDADPDAVGELDTFYSHPSVWGRGVGRALMQEALTALRSAGFKEATLWTAEANRRPSAIYAVAGWRTDGAVKEKTFLGVSFKELRHRIELSSS